jgi:hypothetical protein
MRFLTDDAPVDRPVIRALSHQLLVAQLGGHHPPTALVDLQVTALSALVRAAVVTVSVQLDVRDGDTAAREWVHVRMPDGGMDAYIALDDLDVTRR